MKSSERIKIPLILKICFSFGKFYHIFTLRLNSVIVEIKIVLIPEITDKKNINDITVIGKSLLQFVYEQIRIGNKKKLPYS